MPSLAYSSAQFVYSRLRKMKNQALNFFDAPVIVLLYHRVTTLANDPQMLAVTPENFRAQMRHLRDHFPLVRFEQEWRGSARPAVCVTFDDGFADNALEALPILEELGVPATFFVSTGNIGSSRQFWWDELEQILLESESLPGSFPLRSGSVSRSWPTDTASGRRALYDECARLMTAADTGSRDQLLAGLRSWASAEPGAARVDRALSLDELRLLAASSLVTIGAHTVSHPQLSSLTSAAQRQEIVNSKRQLEEWLGREVSVFSYPYGRRCHYTRQSIAQCREARFLKAASNFPGQAHRWSDPYQLPRHLVRNWPVELFAEKLRGFWTR
jgi:peptidoglycan/xylan/chitin deacetylase (PgdA/CDA1 family)